MASSAEEQLKLLLAEEAASVRDRERSSFDRIADTVEGRVVLFGAGSLGRSCLSCLLRDGIRPLAFCDNNPALWGTEIEGVPVVSPASAVKSFGASAAFFVTIWMLSQRYAETHASLTAAGCKHVYPAAPLRWKYPEDLLPFFLQDLPSKVYLEADGVLAAFQLWADETSRAEYLAQIRYRAQGDLLGLSPPDAEPSYFLDSLFALQPGEVFVDCGAYDGDTVREVIQRNPAFARIMALEPDPKNFKALRNYLASLPPDTSSRISAEPYAVSCQRGELRFQSTGDLSSTLSTSGELVIDAVSLDELLDGLVPTFIKMDIEGAEVDALEGARSVIAQHRPILAICLYHRQSDLWRIPLLIHSIYPGYRYFLRTHETDGWQTVGYAIPPERLNDGVQ